MQWVIFLLALSLQVAHFRVLQSKPCFPLNAFKKTSFHSLAFRAFFLQPLGLSFYFVCLKGFHFCFLFHFLEP